MKPFDTLLQIDTNLTEWIVSAAAATDEQRIQMTRVLALRADLDGQLNALVAYRLQMAVVSLPEENDRLAAVATTMQSIAKSIDTVQSVLAAVGTAVSIAAKFASIVT